MPVSLSWVPALGQPLRVCVCSPAGPGPPPSSQRSCPGHGVPRGGVWSCGRRCSWVLPVGRDLRTESVVKSGLGSLLLCPAGKRRIRDSPKDPNGEQAEGAGLATVRPSTQQSFERCWGAALRSGHHVWCWSPAAAPHPPQHRAPPGLVKWGSCRRQECLITEQPWKPAPAAALRPGGEAAGL